MRLKLFAAIAILVTASIVLGRLLARYVPSAAFAGSQGPHRSNDVSPIAASTSDPICFLAMLTSGELSMSDL